MVQRALGATAPVRLDRSAKTCVDLIEQASTQHGARANVGDGRDAQRPGSYLDAFYRAAVVGVDELPAIWTQPLEFDTALGVALCSRARPVMMRTCLARAEEVNTSCRRIERQIVLHDR
jgi:hypothetical protein